MNVKGLNKQPTAYEELTFFDRIYKTENELRARLRETGYKKYKDINVPKVDCFIYVPSGFPTSASQVLADISSANCAKGILTCVFRLLILQRSDTGVSLLVSVSVGRRC